VLCAASTALAAPDVSQLAAHLEEELTAAHKALGSRGDRLEAHIASQQDPTLLGKGVVEEVGALRSELPELVGGNTYLFPELFAELTALEQHGQALATGTDPEKRKEHLAALQKQGPGVSHRLRLHVRQSLARLGAQLGAPPALVVSGGVSLGSYQAGFLYYYTLFLHDRAWVLRQIPAGHRASLKELGLPLPEDPPSGFTIVTGASAGSVNALLAAYTGCHSPERDPSKSLFFQTWNTLSLETLLAEDSVGEDHLFSSKPVQDAINRLKLLDADGWLRCRFSLGATTTRLDSRQIDLASTTASGKSTGEPLRLARFTEKFLLTATGEPGRGPEFCPFPGCGAQPPPGPEFYPQLAQPEGGPIPVDTVYGMVAASGAFPTAFEPRHIPHRYYDSRTRTWVEDDKTLFSDGGIYNNNPLDLAVRMSQWELPSLRDSHRFLYFDPNSVDWKWADDVQKKESNPGLLSTYQELLEGFASTAMQAQLMDTLEGEPEIRERLDVPIRHAPLAGEHLMAMSGFLDEDFRIFDFHRGMVDAWHFMTKESPTHVIFDELAHTNPDAKGWAIHVESPLFACFLAFEQSEASEPGTLPACSQLQTPESGNIQHLMAVSRKLRKDPTLSQANKFDRFTEALIARGYIFRSGMLKGQPASALRSVFREVAGEATGKLSSLQPAPQRLGFEVATKLALDSAIAYQPRPFYVFLGVTSGGLEVAASPRLTSWGDKELRLRGGLRGEYTEFARLSNGSSARGLETTAALTGVLGMAVPSLQAIRYEVGLGFLTEGTYRWELEDKLALRFAAEASLTLVGAEHLEVSLRPRVYFDGGKPGSRLYVRPDAQGEPPEELSAVGLLLGAGWRF
jgi:predicted acylesterase/phospholipase RssA